MGEIPGAVLGQIFALLGPSEKPVVRLVCKHWCQVAAGVPGFWEDLCLASIADPNASTGLEAVRVLCRLLEAQRCLLRRLEVSAFSAEHTASLSLVLSSLAAAPLEHLGLWVRQLGLEQVEVSLALTLASLHAPAPRCTVTGGRADINGVFHTGYMLPAESREP